MKILKKTTKAFSLIELSIVILIIGILVAGVTSSSRLIKRMKIIVAQNSTQSSPVPSIKDLAVWYESSLDKSFNDNEESDQTPITTWYDNNIQSSFKIDFKQATVANQPKYSEGIINGLPAVKFDGVDDFLLASSTGISGKGLTIFLVGQRIGNFVATFGGPWQALLGGLASGQVDDSSSGSVLAFADFGSTFTTSTNLTWFSNTLTHPGAGVPYIFETLYTGTMNTLFLNGSPSANYNVNTVFAIDTLRAGCSFYNTPYKFHNGYIAEIIIYSRALNTEERKAVESYLSKKYAIKIT